MPRPRVMCFTGKDAAEKWREIGEYTGGLTAEKVAELLGFTSAGAYRGWKAKKPPRIPVEVWARFEAIRTSIKDQEATIDEQFAISRLLKNPIRLGSGELRAVVLVCDDFHGFLGVNGNLGPVEYRGETRACAWEGCDQAFIPRSWNHRVCNRQWHQEEERKTRTI